MIPPPVIVPLVALLLFCWSTTESFSQNLDVPSAAQVGLLRVEEGAVVVEVRGIATENFVTAFVGDSLLLPFTAFCNFLRISSGVSPDRDTLFGEFPVGQPFRIIRSTRTAHYKSKQHPIGDSALYEDDGDIYVDRGLLEECLGLPLRFSLVNLQLNVDPDVSIPLVDQARREEQYASLMFYGAEAGTSGGDAAISRPLVGSLNIDWQMSGQMRKEWRSAFGTARLGGPFLFGTLELYGSAAYRPDGGMITSLDQWNWRYVFPNSPFLRRVSIGALKNYDVYNYLLEVSNAPLFQSSLFDFSTLDGHTQPGWAVELYDGTQLSQVGRADSLGYYRFEIPLHYGLNNFSIRTIGEHGELLVEDHSATLPIQMIPPGRLDYTARFLAERLDGQSPVSGIARMALGVSDWLTLEGSATVQSSSVRRISPDSIFPSASLQTRPWGSTLVNLAYDFHSRIGSGRIESPISRTGRYHIGIDAYSFDTALVRASGSATLSLGGWQTGVTAFYDAQSSFRRVEATPRVFASFGTIGMAASVTYGLEKRFGPMGEFTSLLPPRNGLLASSLQLMTSTIPGIFLTVRSSIDHTKQTPDRLELMASSTLLWPLQLSLKYTASDYRWNKPALDLTLTLDLDQARINVISGYYEEQLMSTATVGGSVMVSSAGVQLTRNSSLGQAAIVVVGFHDINRNGRRDAGDTTIGVTAASLQSSTKQTFRNDGAFYGLIADVNYEVEVDRWSHAGEGLFPRRQTFPIYTLPSTVHVIQVPFTDGFDVSGTCRLLSSSTGGSAINSPFNGLRIMLSSKSVDALYTGEVFSDGTILISGVAPGEYSIEFDRHQLEARGVEPTSLPETVTVDYGSEQLADILFRVVDRSGE